MARIPNDRPLPPVVRSGNSVYIASVAAFPVIVGLVGAFGVTALSSPGLQSVESVSIVAAIQQIVQLGGYGTLIGIGILVLRGELVTGRAKAETDSLWKARVDDMRENRAAERQAIQDGARAQLDVVVELHAQQLALKDEALHRLESIILEQAESIRVWRDQSIGGTELAERLAQAALAARRSNSGK